MTLDVGMAWHLAPGTWHLTHDTRFITVISQSLFCRCSEILNPHFSLGGSSKASKTSMATVAAMAAMASVHAALTGLAVVGVTRGLVVASWGVSLHTCFYGWIWMKITRRTNKK